MFTADADIFFEDPNSGRHSPGQFGVLYLLRRDIFCCMGIDPITKKSTNYMALWPGTMGILAGIDLLGKFFAGSDQRGRVGKRFCDYVDEYFQPISTGDGGVIYQLRNALLHSFGLYSEDKGRIYKFVLVQKQSQLIQKVSIDTYRVDIRELHRGFEESVRRYRVQLENDKDDLQRNFTAMFPKYGAIVIE